MPCPFSTTPPVPDATTYARSQISIFSYYAAGITTAIGICILFAWHLGTEWLFKSAPFIFETKYNTAISLVSLGLGLAASLSHASRLRWVFSLPALFIGAGTLLEYITDTSVGLDTLFYADQWHKNILHTGRMSINSALCFTLASTALLLMERKDTHRGAYILIEAIVLFTTLMAIAAMGGYLASAQILYSWDGYAKMAPQTAIAFLFWSLGAAAHMHRTNANFYSTSIWLPGILCFFILWFDLSTPLGVAAGIAYIPLILCGQGFTDKRMPFILAGIASALTILGYFYSPNMGQFPWIVIVNRVITIAALWFVAALAYHMRRDNLIRIQSETRLKAVLETVLDGIITIDSKGRIRSFNPASVRIFGYEPDEVIGKNVNILMPEPYHSEHDIYLKNYLITGDKKIIGIGREVSGSRKDGSIFPMDLSVNEMRVDGQRMFVGTVRDISDRKQQEDMKNQLMDRLMASNTELERFAYIASHDMQEPIRMVTSFSEIIAKDYSHMLDDTGREYLKFVINGGLRMRDLVDDLLAYSRVGNESIQITDFDAEHMLEGVLENLQGLIKEKKAVITHDRLPKLYGNPVQVMRLLQNLITNALKYQSKTDAPRIHISWQQTADERRISVKDNGMGIKPQFLSQIFQPFRRLHTWESINGTGLGLAICKKIAENHGGKIWVTSIPGTGSVFYFTLSRKPSQTQEAA